MACESQFHTIMTYLLTAILVVGYPLSVWWLWRQMHFDLPETGPGPERMTGHCRDLEYPPWIEAPFLSPTGRLIAVAPVRSR